MQNHFSTTSSHHKNDFATIVFSCLMIQHLKVLSLNQIKNLEQVSTQSLLKHGIANRSILIRITDLDHENWQKWNTYMLYLTFFVIRQHIENLNLKFDDWMIYFCWPYVFGFCVIRCIQRDWVHTWRIDTNLRVHM